MRVLATLLFALPILGATCTLPVLTPAEASPELLIEQARYQLALNTLTGPDAHTAYLKSKAEAGLGDLEASLHSAEHALELEPTRAAYHVQVAAACGRLAEKASIFRQLGLARRAKKELETSLQMEPDNIDAIYGNMLYYYAAPSLVGGDKAKAEAAAESIVKLNAARGFLARAEMAKDKKDYTAEESFYRKSVEANPKFYEARAALAAFLVERNHEAAENEACEAVHLDPYRAPAWTTLAETAVWTQCWDEMFSRVAEANAALPESQEPNFAAGVALVRVGMHYSWAIKFLEHYTGPNRVVAAAKLEEARAKELASR